jgi:hypothetical protein
MRVSPADAGKDCPPAIQKAPFAQLIAFKKSSVALLLGDFATLQAVPFQLSISV